MGGNTKQPIVVSPTMKRYRKWTFTINNPLLSNYPEKLEFCKKYIYQLEEGKSQTRHLQGCFELEHNKTITALKKFLPTAHLEPCKSWTDSITYCQKRESWVEGPWAKGIKITKPLKLISIMKYWQQKIIDLIKEEPDERTINWYWEEEGCVGKTALAKYICSNHNAMVLSGKGSDCLYAISEWKDKEDLIVIFDFSRMTEEYISYMAIEKIKDGLFFSGKYESRMCIYNAPHILCFSNFRPNTEMLSKDRWNIVNLSE